ncbi:MAG: chemotaxis protein CheW [Nostocaceae cyanobacterium]|nr:chemotaxis protein CheW [Nostocaceae cyanobacterium]
MDKAMSTETKVSKFIIFKITNYCLALPIYQVVKIVDFSNNNNEFTKIGLVQIGRHTIKILDLRWHNLEINSNLPTVSYQQPFLLIIRDLQKEFCGILVDETPDLLELPHEIIKAIPQSNRRSKGILEMVSHVAVVSQENLTRTIFILDLNRVLNSNTSDVNLPALNPS